MAVRSENCHGNFRVQRRVPGRCGLPLNSKEVDLWFGFVLNYGGKHTVFVRIKNMENKESLAVLFRIYRDSPYLEQAFSASALMIFGAG